MALIPEDKRQIWRTMEVLDKLAKSPKTESVFGIKCLATVKQLREILEHENEMEAVERTAPNKS